MSTVTVTPTVEAGNVPPRVRLDIASADATSTTITRTDPDGTTVPVRTSDGNPLPITSGTALLYDYEMPYQDPVQYSSLESPATISASVTVPESQIWLVHPGVPSLSMPVSLYGDALMEETYVVKQGVFYPMGRTNPVLVSDGTRKGLQSTLTIVTEDLDSLAGIRALVADAGVLLLNIPSPLGMGVDSSYIAVGDVKISRLTAVNTSPLRSISLPFYVVDRPAGGSQSQRTLLDLFNYPTLNALRTAYPTLTALLAGP